jgi:hypothetical protein
LSSLVSITHFGHSPMTVSRSKVLRLCIKKRRLRFLILSKAQTLVFMTATVRILKQNSDTTVWSRFVEHKRVNKKLNRISLLHHSADFIT